MLMENKFVTIIRRYVWRYLLFWSSTKKHRGQTPSLRNPTQRHNDATHRAETQRMIRTDASKLNRFQKSLWRMLQNHRYQMNKYVNVPPISESVSGLVTHLGENNNRKVIGLILLWIHFFHGQMCE